MKKQDPGPGFIFELLTQCQQPSTLGVLVKEKNKMPMCLSLCKSGFCYLQTVAFLTETLIKELCSIVPIPSLKKKKDNCYYYILQCKIGTGEFRGLGKGISLKKQ